MNGIDVREITPAEARAIVPALRVDDLIAAVWGPTDGMAGPAEVTNAFARRARELGVAHCYQGVHDKGVRIESVRRRLGLTRDEMAAMGDDEPDIPMFEACALSACPSDATPTARRFASMITKNPGGHGAAREFIEEILARNGQAEIVTHRPPNPKRGRRS